MTGFFDKLGLSPQERRLVVIVGIVVFIVVNWWFIIPMFGDWGRYEQRLRDTATTKRRYEAEIARQAEYDSKLQALKDLGGRVGSEDSVLALQQEVLTMANLTGLGYGTITPVNRGTTSAAKTNAFFDEATVNLSVNTGEKELLDFLVRLADRDMLVRAKSMDINPDASQMRLVGNLTLVKSFQRKTQRAAATTPAAPAPAARASTPTPPPASSTVAKPTGPRPTPVAPSAATNTPRVLPRALPNPIKQ